MSRFSIQILKYWTFLYICTFPIKAQIQNEESNDSICKSYVVLAKKYSYKIPDSAFYFAHKAYACSKKINYQKGLASSYSRLGILYRNKGEYDKALLYLDSAVKSFASIKDTIWQAHSLQMIGTVYFNKGEYVDQIDYLLLAIELFKSIKADRSIAFAYNHIGSAYQNLNDFEKANNYFKESIRLFSEMPDSAGMLGPVNNIGLIYEKLDSAERALEYYKLALGINKRYVRNISTTVIIGANIAGINHSIGYYDEALQSYESLLRIIPEGQFPQERVLALIGKGHCMISLGKIKSAKKSVDSSYSIAKKLGNKKYIKDAIKLKIELAKAQNNLREIPVLFDELILYKDSILNEEKTEQLAEMEVLYETAKKEKDLSLKELENNRLESEAEKSRLMGYLLGIGLLLIILLASWMIYGYKIRVRQQRLKNELIASELETSQLREKNTLIDLEEKNRSLTSYSMLLAQKNEILQQLKSQLKEKIRDGSSEENKILQNMISSINLNSSFENDWKEFKLRFEKVHPRFFEKLKTEYPSLTANELRLFALLKLELSQKQIASLLNVTSKAIEVAQYRIRKKLNLPAKKDLSDLSNTENT